MNFGALKHKQAENPNLPLENRKTHNPKCGSNYPALFEAEPRLTAIKLDPKHPSTPQTRVLPSKTNTVRSEHQLRSTLNPKPC